MTPALLCAKVSELVYADPEDWEGLADALGLNVAAQYDHEGTQAVLLTDYRLNILAYRGTDNWTDLKTDAKYIKQDFPGGGRVHRGFYIAFAKIYDAVHADLGKTSLPLVTTGHSLGAALAVMAAVTWGANQFHVYGCPRVGNGDFVKRLKCPGRRYENWCDLVTYVPPPNSFRQAYHALRHGRAPTLYKHAGERVGLSGFGHPINRYVKATRTLGQKRLAAAREVA